MISQSAIDTIQQNDKPAPTEVNTAPVATYVYEGAEVKLTGRTASREVKQMTTRTPSGTPRVTNHVLYEITPVHQTVGVWFKWVPFESLYKVR